jgi:hypothetical protein
LDPFAGLAAASLLTNTGVSAQQAAGGSAEVKLRELGIELPKVPAPVANYVPAARLGNIIFLAGAGPLNPDGSRPQGKVGRDVTLEQANQHARKLAFNCWRRRNAHADRDRRRSRQTGPSNFLDTGRADDLAEAYDLAERFSSSAE